MISSGTHRLFREGRILVLIILVLWVLGVFYAINPLISNYKFITLHKILKAGEMTILTRNSPHCYYLYRDEPMGFEYDLAQEFAEYLGVELKVKIAENWRQMIAELKNGNAALIAAGITVTPQRQKRAAFSKGYMDIQQHIISHRNGSKIKTVNDLAGKTVHVQTATAYQERLEELRGQGIDLTIELHKDLLTEELIQRVADGEIELTVADSNIARLNQRHYPGAVVASAISEMQHLGWAVYPEAHQLRGKINSFFASLKNNGRFDEIFNKYYGDIGKFDYVDLRAFHRRVKSRLSRYSPFIKAAAKKHGFDWRLIAAQAYQESHLDPRAKSRSGAKGLMQLLTSTARSLKVADIYNPVDNINGGVQHLKVLYDLFGSATGDDRLMIALAAYNVGQGHLQDARNLAINKKLDPDSWASLSQTLPLLRYRKYYKKAKYGYCRGTEPVRYVKQIMIYYDILKRQGIEYGEAQAKLQLSAESNNIN
jgi:membrane-bound lytic murein transglycosylase F